MTLLNANETTPWTEKHLLAEIGRSMAATDSEFLQYKQHMLEQYLQTGFPSRKNEYWKYTSVNALKEVMFFLPQHNNEGNAFNIDITPYRIPDTWAMVFVDGVWAESLSELPESTAINISSLDVAWGQHKGEILDRLKQLNQASLPFFQLNRALMTTGLWLSLSKNQSLSKPLHMIYLTTGSQANQMNHPCHIIDLAEGAEATILEDYISLSTTPVFNNVVMQATIGDNASLHHYFQQRDNKQSVHIYNSNIQLERDARLSSVSSMLSGATSRQRHAINLSDKGASVDLKGFYYADDQRQADVDLELNHIASHTNSSQFFRGIVNDKAKASFCGRAIIPKDLAQVTARQTNNNLLLSPYAQLNCRPQLEIYSDDVECSHGATVGALDPQVLFYLQSRGIEQDLAHQMVLNSFAAELFDVDNNQVECYLLQNIQQKIQSIIRKNDD